MFTLVIDGNNCFVLLLPCSIPDLELDFFILNRDSFGYICCAKGRLGMLIKLISDES